MNQHIAIYPGSFDPITNGHLDIITRGLDVFDQLIVAVARNSEKTSLFTVEERIGMIRDTIGDNSRLLVDSFEGLLVDYAAAKEARVILRGLRAVSDFEYEFQLAQMNHAVRPEIETLFMMTSASYGYLSSSIVKEVASHNGEIGQFVPPAVQKALQRKFAQT